MTYSTITSPGVSLQGGGGSGGGGGASLPLIGTGATVTASAPLLDLSQTWNNAAVAFTGVKANFTDTASAAGSLLLDLQVGGSTRHSVAKSGQTTFFSGTSRNVTIGGVLANAVRIGSTSAFGFSSNIDAAAADIDTILTRRAAANLRFGAADAASPVAQTLSVQSVSAGTTNVAGANLTITGSQGTGSGAGGSIIFQVAPAGASGTAQNALVDAVAFDSSGFVQINRLQARIRFSVDGTFIAGNDSTIINISNVLGIRQNTNAVFLGSGATLSWGASGFPSNTGDTVLARDAANALALRNGTNNQELRVYGSYTSATVYDRMTLKSSSTVATVAAETDAGDMDLALTPAGAGKVRFGTHAAIGAETVTGYIEIKDAGGTVRKLAVVS